MLPSPSKEKIPWPFIVILVLVSIFGISGGILFFKSQKEKISYEKENELAAIISLKVADIERWRMEHLRDGDVLSNDPILKKQISDFLTRTERALIRQHLLRWMQTFTRYYDYHSVILLDDSGIVRLSLPSGQVINDTALVSAVENLGHLPVLNDLHVTVDGKGIQIDLLIPLTSDEDKKIGTLILKIDPDITLFPLIQSWPTPSRTSETLLLRLDGDSVLFLNELKHLKNTALKLKLPLSDKNLPAAAAGMGYEGVFYGFDYREIPVISYLRKIPGSPWFMVAKVDRKEIYSPLKEQVALISIIVFLVIFSSGTIVIVFWRNQRMLFFKELNDVKDKFFTIISHDLKNPFVSIIGFAELLQEKVKNKDLDKAGEYASIIYKSSYKAIDLLNNLTEWTRLQTGKKEFFPGEHDVVPIIDEVVELLNASAQQKSITINTNLANGCKIVADKEMISSVLRNLISNAIKFTYSGGKVSVNASCMDNEVRVEVKDSGVGIKPEVMAGLFQLGRNISTPGTKNEEGTGLGLILCMEFISRHNGRLWAESVTGKGSRFIFTLPRK